VGENVFVSYAMKDQAAARAVVEAIETTGGLRGWIAPRDVAIGEAWASAIPGAIRDSRLLVVMVSEHSLKSPHVAREVGLAARYGVPIWPIQLDQAVLSGDLEYYLAGIQIDTDLATLTERSLAGLTARINRVLATPEQGGLLESHTVEPAVAERPPPPGPDPFRIRASSATPGCIILLVDCSNSMNHRLGGGTEARRAVVARSINDILRNLERLSLRDTGMRPYFDVAVLGYGLGDGTEVRSMIGDEDGGLYSIVELAERPLDEEIEVVHSRRPNGDVVSITVRRKVWVLPTANQRGRTVALRAFSRAYELARTWVAEHAGSPPPIVVNITDGGYDDDENPETAVRSIQELATAGGNAVVFNCHLSDARVHALRAGAALFPTDEDAEGFPPVMRSLHDQSSLLPDAMLRRATEMQYDVQRGARGYVYNADSVVLIDFLDIGTIRTPAP
jgi:hypothetical protein